MVAGTLPFESSKMRELLRRLLLFAIYDDTIFAVDSADCGDGHHQYFGLCVLLQFLSMPMLQVMFSQFIPKNRLIIDLNLTFFSLHCRRGTLFIADDNAVRQIHDNGVMLQTAESIRESRRDLLLSNDSMAKSDANGLAAVQHEIAESEPADSVEPQPLRDADRSEAGVVAKRNEMTSISILQWNVLGLFGRYWSRYPLIATTINDLEPDILCLQSAVTVQWWNFGTLNMLKRIDSDYRGFHVSRYNQLHDQWRLCFHHSFCWRIINEFQGCCNLYCLVPFWKRSANKQRNGCCSSLFSSFTGLRTQNGNAIAFKKNHQLFRSYISLSGGGSSLSHSTAMRALYVMRDEAMDSVAGSPYNQRLSVTMKAKKERKRKRKKIWIVCTQLSDTADTAPTDVHENGDETESDIDLKVSQLIQLRQIVDWMEKAQRKICKADAIIIAGDFNATPDSELYQMMKDKGYRSAVLARHGKEQWTFPTDTWRYGMESMESMLTEEDTKRTRDYVWIKSSCPIRIENVRLVGRHYIDSEHRDENIKIYPSDHLGIYVKLAI